MKEQEEPKTEGKDAEKAKPGDQGEQEEEGEIDEGHDGAHVTKYTK